MADRGYTAALLQGIGERFTEWGLGTLLADNAGPTADTFRPIYWGPTDRTDLRDDRWVIQALPEYTPAPGSPTVVTAVAFNWRGLPVTADGGSTNLDALDVIDQLFIHLQDKAHVFGEVEIGRVWRQSAGVLAPDTARRQGASATYLFRGRRGTITG